MTKYKYCFLDMDGVLTNFVKAACLAHNRTDPYLDSANHGIFDMDQIWKMSSREFWKPSEVQGFWENMEKLPYADDLVKSTIKIFGKNNIAILTSPALGANCVPEKRNWIARNYPELTNQMIFTGAKQFLAHENTLLIDDRDKNVQSFRAYGGNALLYPQKWNSASDVSETWVFEQSL